MQKLFNIESNAALVLLSEALAEGRVKVVAMNNKVVIVEELEFVNKFDIEEFLKHKPFYKTCLDPLNGNNIVDDLIRDIRNFQKQ